MPVQEFGAKQNYKVSQPLPRNLEHRPLYAMPYQPFDGKYIGDTDARYLSIGISQWSREDVSLKIMRYASQWSRQAEELPLHRVVDTSIFLAKVLFDEADHAVEIERGLFENQPEGFRVEREACDANDVASFDAFLSKHEPALRDRFNKLHQLLSNLKAQGKL